MKIIRFVEWSNYYWTKVRTYRVNPDGSRDLIGLDLIANRPIPYGML